MAGLGFGGANEGATGVAHAGGVVAGPESDHTGIDHLAPLSLQVGILPNLALELLKGVGHVSWGLDESPA